MKISGGAHAQGCGDVTLRIIEEYCGKLNDFCWKNVCCLGNSSKKSTLNFFSFRCDENSSLVECLTIIIMRRNAQGT
jgi:hypothetical protein